MTENAVVNASPLILLSKIGRASLLTKLFDEVVVPNAVWKEIVVGGENEPAAALPSSLRNLTRVNVEAASPEVARCNLGDGETEVLTFALIEPTYRAVVDDKAARTCAKDLGIRILGTGGLLILAKRKRFIPSVETELRKLVECGLWLSPEVMRLLLSKAGE